METAYLELLPTVGIDGAGNPEPLKEIGLPVTIRRQVKGEIVEELAGIRIQPSPNKKHDSPGRIVPNTRIVATSQPQVLAALLDSGQYVLTDPPRAGASRVTADHRAARTRSAPRKRTAPAKKTAPAAPAAPSTPDPTDTTVDPENKEQ